jgi:hypothetical protein
VGFGIFRIEKTRRGRWGSKICGNKFRLGVRPANEEF